MKRYFEGWYLKQQSDDDTIAFIPAHHIDYKGNHSASLQIISSDGSFHIPYDISQFSVNRTIPEVVLANHRFSPSGIAIDIDHHDISAHGKLNYTKQTPLNYDIMGPFRYVPFMECRHSVFSLSHVVNGSLTLNGKTIVFRDAMGYMEGDRGCSFPKHYAWTQCNFENGCIMLSIADIPLLGTHFTGIIGVVLYQGKQYRLATYLGATALQIKHDKLQVVQGDSMISVRRISHQDAQLKAPVCGDMKRVIHESQACKARFRFFYRKTLLLDFVSDAASFEYEYPDQTT